MSYWLHLLIYFSMYAILALGLNLVVGYCGLFTMAHAAFFAVGGYTYALATMHFGCGYLPAALLAMFIAGVLSLTISLPAWRFRGDFFVLTSIAVQSLLFSIIHNWSSTDSPPGTLWNLTNGPLGLAGIARPAIFGINMDTISSISGLSLVLLLLSGFVFWRLGASPWGRLLKSMRDDELAARGLGKDVRLAKVHVLAITCAFAALSGTIYASYVTYIDPSIAALDQSILFLSILIVGGTGNFRGPLVGAAVMLAIPEFLRIIHLPEALTGNVQLLVYGLLLIVIMHFRPQGLAGEYKVK
jgi:branched-chain amino acid transport system permease protein